MFLLLKKMRQIIFFYCLFSNIGYTPTANVFNCHLPDGCRFERGFISDTYDMNEIGNRLDILMIMCDINNNEFRFKFKDPPNFVTGKKCLMESNHGIKIYFKWTSKELTILESEFNFTNVFKYLSYMKKYSIVFLWSLKGFDVNFLGKNYKSSNESHISIVSLSKLRLDFYHNKKIISSCDDIIKSNVTNIMSIFQLKSFKIRNRKDFELRSVEYKQSICPLVFNNSIISHLILIDLADTFYKRNFL